MKIQLLGTAGGDFPRIEDPNDNFAYLPRVRALGGKNLRRPAQAFIFPDILIDFHDDRQLEKLGIKNATVNHLFITHAHWDHFQPLEILDFAAGLPHQLQVYGSATVIDALKFANTYDYNRSNGRFTVKHSRTDIGYHELEPEQTYELPGTTVATVHANHSIDKSAHMIMAEQCLNYVFERGGKTIFYGLDSSYPFPTTVDYLQRYRIDVAVLDATFGQWPIDPVKSGHHNFEMLGETIEEFRHAGVFHDETVLVASHIALAEIKPHDDLCAEASQMGLTLAYDGITFEADMHASSKRRVLFVCTGNAGRSQMAEALSRTHYGDKIEPFSAGVDPWPDLHPMARTLMAERGETLLGHHPKHVTTFVSAPLDLIVTIGDRARDECPEFPGDIERIHWEISDPADADGTLESEDVFRDSLAKIEKSLANLSL